MWVYLMRHGDAVDARLAGGDEARWLTEFGREESLRTARELKGRGGEVQRIFSSPYVRAAQTAELAATVLGYSTELSTLDALVPDGDPSLVIDALSALDPSVCRASYGARTEHAPHRWRAHGSGELPLVREVGDHSD